MSLLAVIIAVPLTAIAALHAYWGIGGVWPGADQRSCARAVAGFKGIDTMPSPAACFAVAGLVVAVTLVVLALGDLFASPFARQSLAGAAFFVALVFLFRGLLGFTSYWRRLTPEMPFARLDARYYSPLCLVVGAALAVLAFEGLATS
ncbi:hypothetical protein MesoLjLb_05320 [Mesorhizobium sp. L-8-3]|nr:DUF3995 domain-containing protein [Mesorhizobium sp. L-8-3]BCH20747.1 hypothetical protein MesoLjLb_05320 [Mesorhizobium sp. L-8-3]